MSADSDPVRTELLAAVPVLAETFDALVSDAARTLSPAGCKAWLDGARGLQRLGRGPEPVLAWLDNLPAVVRECGEDVIGDTLEAMMKLASLTSGAVIALALTTLPAAARRMGDPDLLRGYLRLLHRVVSRAPRGLRPMLGVLEELLGKLTLSGLGRWVDFGAEAYRRDLAGQVAYFGLETEDSRAVLQAERRGTLFIDQQRKLNLYLRAFWARDFFLRPAAVEGGQFRPYVSGGALHLPDAVDDLPGVSGAELYRAMAAHLAAHIVHTRKPLSEQGLSPAQRFFIGLVEDARVEYCAIRAFPGLAALWRRLHPGADAGVDSPKKTGTDHDFSDKSWSVPVFSGSSSRPAASEVEHPGLALLETAALGMLDRQARIADDDVAAFVDDFHVRIAAGCEGGAISMELGLALFDLLQARQAVPSLRVLEALRIPYRDDNRLIWQAAEFAWLDDVAYLPASQRQVRRKVSLMEFVNELDTETAGDDAQEVWVLDGVLYDDDGTTWNEREGREPVSEPHHYPEWDYRVQLFRPDWATVFERRASRGDADRVERILLAHKPVAARIRHIVDRLRPQGVIRERKLEDGDELDLNAAVDAVVALRSGMQPDTRITMRNRIQRRDLAVLILLDLSESTNDTVRDSDKTVLDLTCEASALVATAIAGIGDPFAIHGFSSDGRHDVQYRRFKDFDQRLDADAKARLAGMKGGLSTRMGAAMRHAGQLLRQQPARRKLLLVVTDGEPADIDERDPQTLRQDARKAVEGLHAQGVDCYCLTLDPKADPYVSRIFGGNRYTIVDRVESLPDRLPSLFASLTR